MSLKLFTPKDWAKSKRPILKELAPFADLLEKNCRGTLLDGIPSWARVMKNGLIAGGIAFIAFCSNPTSLRDTNGPANGIRDLTSWTMVYDGYGSVTIDGNSVLLCPLAVTSPNETQAALVTNSDSIPTNFTLQMKIDDIRQLRQNSPPNSWEVGWVLFNYRDPDNFYYFLARTDGIELGKAVNGNQVYLSTPIVPNAVIGQPFNFKLTYDDGTTTVYMNNKAVISYSEVLPYANKIAVYAEDSQVDFSDIKAGPAVADTGP